MFPSILIVDDEPHQREMLCRILDRAGYETRAAADGRDPRRRKVVVAMLRMGALGVAVAAAALAACSTAVVGSGRHRRVRAHLQPVNLNN